MQRKLLAAAPMYDKKLRCTILPWTHSLHSWVGYMYVFDDKIRAKDMLIYFVPVEGQMRVRCHYTTIQLKGDGSTVMKTDPDPEKDKEMEGFVI